MFCRIHRSFFVLLFLLLSQISCGPSQSFVQGTAAEAVGDWHAAVINYRAALAEDPGEEDLQQRLWRSEQQLVLTTAAQVNDFLSKRDFEGALVVIAPELLLLPFDSTLLQSRDDIRTQGLAYCRELHDGGRYRHAYEQAVVLQRYFTDDAELNSARVRARAEFANELEIRASRAQENGLTGLALLSLAEHHDLFGDRESFEQAAALRDQLEREIAYRYYIETDGLLADQPFPSLPEAMVVTESPPDLAQVRIRANLGDPRFEETYSVGIRYQSYLAGYEEIPNPAYDSALWDMERAERDVLYQEREVLEAERAVHGAEVDLNLHRDQDDHDTYFTRWDIATRALQDERDDLQHRRERLHFSRERLRQTPPTYLQEVWSEFPYEVRTYSLTGMADFSASTETVAGTPRRSIEILRAVTTDETHEGFPEIGVVHDPLQYPYNPDGLTQLLKLHAAQVTQTLLVSEFDIHRDAIRSTGLALASEDPEQAVEHLVRYLLLDPTRADADVLLQLDELADLWNVGVLAAIP